MNTSLSILSLAGTLCALSGQSPAHAAAGLAGTWEARSHCAAVAGSREPACATQGKDFFALRLFVKNGSVCGTHSVVSAGGNHVDEIGGSQPSIQGVATAGNASISFTSASGGTGMATLTLRGNKLLWRITSESGEHWLPEQVALHPVRSGKWGAKINCGGARSGV